MGTQVLRAVPISQLIPKCSPFAATYESLNAMSMCPQQPCSQKLMSFCTEWILFSGLN